MYEALVLCDWTILGTAMHDVRSAKFQLSVGEIPYALGARHWSAEGTLLKAPGAARATQRPDRL